MGQTMMRRILAGALRTNCYLIYNEETKETLIIDPADEADKIGRIVEENSLRPAAILLTHGHFDHIGAVSGLKERYGCEVYCLGEEKGLMENMAYNLSSMFSGGFTVTPDELLKDGDELSLAGFHIRVIATPGHTKGSCCYYFPEDRFLMSGDTLFEESVGRSDFPTGSAQALVRSIREKLFVLPDDTPVYTGHGEPTTIGHEKRYNPAAGVQYDRNTTE